MRRIGSAILAGAGWGLYDNILDDYLKGKKPVRLTTKQQIFLFFKKLWPVLHEKYSFVNNQCDYAIGAMHVLYDQEKSAEEIARLAIEAAISNNVYCGGNIEIIKP